MPTEAGDGGQSQGPPKDVAAPTETQVEQTGLSVSKEATTTPEMETVLSPRERVEASFKERRETVMELNHLVANRSDGYFKGSYEDYLTSQETLEKKLRDQNITFITDVVSHEPEAQAWVDLTTENYQRTSRDLGGQRLYGPTPTAKQSASLDINSAGRHYREAAENLAKVREKAAALTPTSPQPKPENK